MTKDSVIIIVRVVYMKVQGGWFVLVPRALVRAVIPWALMHLTAALPIRERASCDMVQVVHTNMSPAHSSELLELYISMAKGLQRSALDAAAICGRVAHAFGGTWELYVLGEAFSYSVHCLEYAEFAGEHWTVMLCKAAADTAAVDCGNEDLTLYGNGTLGPQPHPSWALSLDFYSHEDRGDELSQSRFDDAIAMISDVEPPSEVSKGVATRIREKIEAQWKTRCAMPAHLAMCAEPRLSCSTVAIAALTGMFWSRRILARTLCGQRKSCI
jgi:hypothetical protein